MNYQPRVTTFGRHSVKLEARPGELLEPDFIRQYAPALFAEQPHSSRSERFAHIPTHQMMDALIKEGWAITGVSVGGSNDAEKRAFTKHMLRLRRNDQLAPRNITETVPEVVLKNGHDGTSQYILMMGLFRFICMNGMIVPESIVGEVKVPHRGHALDKVIEGTFTVIDQGQKVLERVDDMKQIGLSTEEQTAFAKSALVARFGDDVPAFLAERPTAIIRPRRPEDRTPDLWTVYNRAQENLLKGGIGYTEERTREGSDDTQVVHVRTRPVRSVDGDIKLNKALFTLAEEMAAIKAAG